MYMLFCSVRIISRLVSQSKFQMFTPFSGRPVGVPRRYTNITAPYWAKFIFILRDTASQEYAQ